MKKFATMKPTWLTINTIKKTKHYVYKNILVQDKTLIDYELVKKWNSGVDIIKHGANIEIKIRKAI